MTMTAERPAVATAGLEKEHQPAPSKKQLEQNGVHVWRWTRDDYHRASDMGLFGDQRVELLDGEILVMAGQKTPHFTSVQLAADLLIEAFGPEYRARQQGPIVLSDDSEPEPDVVIVPGTVLDYADHHPTPPEIRLAVEVSDATLATDRGSKRAAYAREGLAEYWIVNLVNRRLEVYRDPATVIGEYVYKVAMTLFEGDTVTPLFAPEFVIAVAELFPPIQPADTDPPN